MGSPVQAIPSGKKLTKPALADVIGAELGTRTENPVRSQGTVLVQFMEEVVELLGGDPDKVPKRYGHRNYDLLASALQLVGGEIDLRLDTSAEAPTGGGGTLTSAGFAHLLDGVRKVRGARYFIVNQTDAKISAKYDDDVGHSYGFDDSVSGRLPLIDASGDARVIFYRTSKSSRDPKTFGAHAGVDDVVSVGAGRWVALLRDYREFSVPVSRASVEIDGWNPQVSITEVCRGTYDGLLALGGSSSPPRTPRGTSPDAAARLMLGPIPLDAPVHGTFGALAAEDLPAPVLLLSSPPGELVVAGNRWRGGNRVSDKAAEERAVAIARAYLAHAGWTLVHDAQRDGVGYDLEFSRSGERLLVEVKGIQGPNLRFNMTAREWQRAELHAEFIVVAVTNVLKEAFEVHVLRQPDLFASRRVITQYRVDAT